MFGLFDYPAYDDLYRFRRQMNDVFSEFDRHFGLMNQDPFLHDPFFNRDLLVSGGDQQQQQQRLQAAGKDAKAEENKYTGASGAEQKGDTSMSIEPTGHMGQGGAGALTRTQPSNQALSFPRHGGLMSFPKIHLPKCDVIENADNYQVTCELPGMTKEDVKLSVNDDGVMTILAERSSTSEQKDPAAKYHRKERHYGKFERTLPLPKNVQLDQVTAKHENGLLKINVPKKPQPKEETPKHIQIQ